MKAIIFTLLFSVCLAYAQGRIGGGPYPSFELDIAAKRRLVEKALTLEAGDAFASVTNALGLPALAQTLRVNKEGRRVAHQLQYHALIWERGKLKEASDEFITIWFGEGDRLQSLRINVRLR